MESIKLLIQAENFKEPCFLCFKCDENNLDIYTVFEIRNECEFVSLSLADMYRDLFPNQDIDFRQACENCADLISEFYILLHRRKTKTSLLNGIVKELAMKTDEIGRTNVKHNKQIMLNIQLPIYQELKSINSTVSKADGYNYQDNVLNIAPTFICEKPSETVEGLECHENKDHKIDYVSHKKIHRPDQSTQQKRQRKCKYHHCNDCDYKTLSKTTLQAHINKKHLCTRPHICQVCCKGFYNRSNLNEHLITHNGQRNEVCEQCGCSFIHKKNLIEHLRLHSDTRPYECHICGKRFVTSGRRSDHMKRTHMERTECCLVCNKKYSLRKELTRHMNNVHLKSM